MQRWLCSVILALTCVGLACGTAFAQGGSTRSSLSGLVVDTDGGLIPGATVVIKSTATGIATTLVTNSSGTFTLPSLDPGTYTVTISLSGFKTVVVSDVKVIAASPADLGKLTLAVGNLTEKVEVKGGTDLVQTQSGTVSSTLGTEQLKNVPLPTRNALYAVNLLPGVDTTGTVRASTISGLPQYTINITLDGVNVNNNMQRQTDGFYAMVRPQLDAIEEVTLTSATQGADSAGQGAVQVRFQTRSGTNTYRGTAYDYYRNPVFNTNYWFNELNGLPKNHVVLHQGGGSEGGPIVLPGLFDGHGKAFFFFNYEEFYQPTSATRTRTILSSEAQSGLFRYTATVNGVSTTQSVNLVQLAAANGQTVTFDPTIAGLLAKMQAAESSTGVINPSPTNPNIASYIFQSPGGGREHLPTTKIDYQFNPKHRLSGSYYWQVVNRFPDIQNNGDNTFPGMPNVASYKSHRTVGSIQFRSTLSANMVNSVNGGWQWSPSRFSHGIAVDQFGIQQGYNLGFPQFAGNVNVTGATTSGGNTAEDRNTPNWNIDDTLNWTRGRHAMSFGGSFTRVIQDDTSWNLVPGVNFGVQSTLDPADAMFTPANFPGASNNNMSDARALYAFLTGRITSITGTARLDDKTSQYVYLGPGRDHLRYDEYGIFAQDSWRATPTLTLNGGLRWEYQTPIVTLNNNYSTATFADLCGISGVGNGPDGRGCNLFKPGTLTGIKPQYIQYTSGTKGYNSDWNNVAPNVSAAWRPNVQGGFLRAILGDPEQATIRAGFSVAFNRNGMDEFQNVFGGNPGRSFSANRSNGNGNLVLPGDSWPFLLRQTSRLGPPPACPAGTIAASCVPQTAIYPIATSTANSLVIFDPNIELSYAKSYSIGLQRAVSKDMVVEARYVGTRNNKGWTTEGWNEINLEENGFYGEFKQAMTNLQSNIAAGRGNTFAYFGAGTGTAPLPIFLAHYNATPASQAGDASKYTGANWTNTTFLGFLAANNPNPFGFASTNTTNGLYGNTTFRANGQTAGLPVNFWLMNPDVSGANIRRSASFTKYDSLQLELRRRLSHGLSISGSYTFAHQWGSTLESVHRPRYLLRTTGTNAIPHSWKLNGTYSIPVGRGKRVGTDMPGWLDTIAGGWDTSFSGRFYYRLLSANGVRLVGMSQQELQDAYKIRIDGASKTVYIFPDDIILNTRRAFNVSATSADGYSSLGAPTGRYIAPAQYPGCVELYLGDCGEPKQIIIRAPLFSRIDLSLKKTISLPHGRNIQVQYDALNIFDNINFNPVFNPGSGATILQVTSGYTDLSQSFDPGGRLGQVMFRINW